MYGQSLLNDRAGRVSADARGVSAVTLVAGKGIEGDRDMISEGFYSHLRREWQNRLQCRYGIWSPSKSRD
jgi:hypothetical protein